VTWLQRLRELVLGHREPPSDERSIRGERLDELTHETRRTMERVDKLVPPNARTARIRREAMLAEQRFRR
jgi:hypothetical protein